jgi:translation initiation factor IF-2
MSSTESSGAPADATATPSAPAAAFPTFGSTRGSGLARGKRPAAGPAASTAAAPEYTPTAIEVVNAPREYQNPFAPAEEPAAASPAPSAVGLAKADAPVSAIPAPLTPAPAASVPSSEPAALNILEPAQPKVAPAQTWESEGFKPAREPRAERAPREERTERPADEPVDIASIPPQFLYVRPGHTYVPTPRNMGGAPRERSERSERPAHGSPERALEASPAASVPAKSGGFFGWLKSLFGGSSSAPVSASTGSNGEHHREGSHRRHRGGRHRGGHGGSEGGQRRDRGGRGRSSGYRGERSEGSRQGGV